MGDSKCQLVNGRPRHPQSQGAVERANRDVCDMLTSWMRENQTYLLSSELRFKSCFPQDSLEGWSSRSSVHEKYDLSHRPRNDAVSL